MESIFNDEATDGNGSQSWRCAQVPLEKVSLRGRFYEEINGEVVSDREYLLSGASLFYREGQRMRQLELIFTVVEEKLYLRNCKKVFALRLSHRGGLTELYTGDQDLFVSFYSELSGLCILTKFEEHYKMKGVLGKGYFSIVYEGQHNFTKRVVALKCYNKAMMKQKPGGIQLVKNEIRNLHELKKFHISPLIEVLETIDAVILVQHKAQAGDMMRFLSTQEHFFDEAMIKGIVKQILDKVALLHAIGYIHRDLKPENILFRAEEPNSPLYLSDLGLTVRKEQLREKNINHYSCGTLGFVAPEVLQYEESLPCYTEACDVFSVGCIFYFLHTGTPLFEGRNKKDLYLKNRHCGELQDKLNKIEQIDTDGLELLRRLLCVDPKLRISAEEASRNQYFQNIQSPGPSEVIFMDTSTDNRSFISKKIERYWAHYGAQIS